MTAQDIDNKLKEVDFKLKEVLNEDNFNTLFGTSKSFELAQKSLFLAAIYKKHDTYKIILDVLKSYEKDVIPNLIENAEKILKLQE